MFRKPAAPTLTKLGWARRTTKLKTGLALLDIPLTLRVNGALSVWEKSDCQPELRLHQMNRIDVGDQGCTWDLLFSCVCQHGAQCLRQRRTAL